MIMITEHHGPPYLTWEMFGTFQLPEITLSMHHAWYALPVVSEI